MVCKFMEQKAVQEKLSATAYYPLLQEQLISYIEKPTFPLKDIVNDFVAVALDNKLQLLAQLWKTRYQKQEFMIYRSQYRSFLQHMMTQLSKALATDKIILSEDIVTACIMSLLDATPVDQRKDAYIPIAFCKFSPWWHYCWFKAALLVQSALLKNHPELTDMMEPLYGAIWQSEIVNCFSTQYLTKEIPGPMLDNDQIALLAKKVQSLGMTKEKIKSLWKSVIHSLLSGKIESLVPLFVEKKSITPFFSSLLLSVLSDDLALMLSQTNQWINDTKIDNDQVIISWFCLTDLKTQEQLADEMRQWVGSRLSIEIALYVNPPSSESPALSKWTEKVSKETNNPMEKISLLLTIALRFNKKNYADDKQDDALNILAKSNHELLMDFFTHCWHESAKGPDFKKLRLLELVVAYLCSNNPTSYAKQCALWFHAMGGKVESSNNLFVNEKISDWLNQLVVSASVKTQHGWTENSKKRLVSYLGEAMGMVLSPPPSSNQFDNHVACIRGFFKWLKDGLLVECSSKNLQSCIRRDVTAETNLINNLVAMVSPLMKENKLNRLYSLPESALSPFELVNPLQNWLKTYDQNLEKLAITSLPSIAKKG
jgi:hypothetical protein